MKRPARSNRTPLRRATRSTVRHARSHASSPMSLWSDLRGFFSVHATGFMATAGVVLVAGLLSFWATQAGVARFGFSAWECDPITGECGETGGGSSCEITFSPANVPYNGTTTASVWADADEVRFRCSLSGTTWSAWGPVPVPGPWGNRTQDETCEMQTRFAGDSISAYGSCSGGYTVAPPPPSVTCAAPNCPSTMGYSETANCSPNITSGTAAFYRWVVETEHGDMSTSLKYDSGYGYTPAWQTITSPIRGICKPGDPGYPGECPTLNTGLLVTLEASGLDGPYQDCGTSYIELSGGAVCENPAIGSFSSVVSANGETVTFSISDVTGTVGTTALVKRGTTTIGSLSLPSGSFDYTLPRDASFNGSQTFTATVVSTCTTPSPVDAVATSSVTIPDYCTSTYTETSGCPAGQQKTCDKIGRMIGGTCTWGAGSSCGACSAIPSCPAITSFSGTPITAGQSSTLSWAVTGSPDSLSINNSVGTVTGTSTTVSPTSTTTYTLTAAKAGCSAATATTQVAVSPAPSCPAITSFTGTSPINAGQSSTLTWAVTNSPDSLSISGVGVVTGTSKSVSPTTTTTYTLTASKSGCSPVTANVPITVNAVGTPSVTTTVNCPANPILTSGYSCNVSITGDVATVMTGNRKVQLMGTQTGGARWISDQVSCSTGSCSAGTPGTMTLLDRDVDAGVMDVRADVMDGTTVVFTGESRTITVLPAPAPSCTLTFSPTQISPGGAVGFTVSATNVDPASFFEYRLRETGVTTWPATWFQGAAASSTWVGTLGPPGYDFQKSHEYQVQVTGLGGTKATCMNGFIVATVTGPTLGLSCTPSIVTTGSTTNCSVTASSMTGISSVKLHRKYQDASGTWQFPQMSPVTPCAANGCPVTTNAFTSDMLGTVDLMVVALAADGSDTPGQAHGHTTITVNPALPVIQTLSCTNPTDGGPLAKSMCTFTMGGNVSSVYAYQLVRPDGRWLSHSVRVAVEPCAGNVCEIDTDASIETPNPLENPSTTTPITNFPIVARLLSGSGCASGAGDADCTTVATANTTITIPPKPSNPLNLTELSCRVAVEGSNDCTIKVTNGASKGVKKIAIRKSQPSGGSWATGLPVGEATFTGTDAATQITVNLTQDAIADVGLQLFWAGALDASDALIASGGSIIVDIIGPVGNLTVTNGAVCDNVARTCTAEAGKTISFGASADPGCSSTGCNHHIFHATPSCFSPAKGESASVDTHSIPYIGFTPTTAGTTCMYTVEVGYDVGSTIVLSKILSESTYTIQVTPPATPTYGVKIEDLSLTGWGTRTVGGFVRLSNNGLATAPYYKVKLLYNAGGPTHVLYAPNCTDPNTSGCGEVFAGPVTGSPITIPLPSYTIPQTGETVTSIAVWAEGGNTANFTHGTAVTDWTSATFTSGGGTNVSLTPMQCGATLYDLTQIGIQVQDPGVSVVDYIKAFSVNGGTGAYTFVGQGQRNSGTTSTAVHFNFAANGIVTPDAGEDHYISFQAFDSESATPTVPLAEAGCHYNVISSWKYDVGVKIAGNACSQDALRPTKLTANTLTTAIQFMCANGADTALANCTNPDPTGNPWNYNVFLTKASDITSGTMVKTGPINASGAGTADNMNVSTVMADPTTVYNLRHNVNDSNGWLKQQSCYVQAEVAALDPQFTQCTSTMTFTGGGCTGAARNDATILLKASADGGEDLSTVRVILSSEPATGVTITPAGATTLTKNGATYDATWTVRLPAAAGSYTFRATIAPGSPGAGRVIKTITKDVTACTAGCTDLGCGCGNPAPDACGVCGGDGSSCQQCANPVCTNGQTRCTGQTPQTCQRSTDPADCGRWVNGTVCVAPQTCQGGTCIDACAAADQPTATLTGAPLTIPATGSSALTIATVRSNGWTLTASGGTLSKTTGVTANDTATFTPNASGNVRIDLRATSANASCTAAVSTINITVTGDTACADGPTATITVDRPTIQRGQTAIFTITTTRAASWSIAGRNPPGNGLAPNQGTGNATTTQVTYAGTTAGTDTVTLTAVKASTNAACANAIASANITVDPGPTSICGDSQVSGAEQCDDGNATSGDGCSNTCALEPPLLVACPGTFITPTGFRGTWTNNIGVAGYKLDLLQGATVTQTANEPRTATFHDWTGLTPSTDYIFRVASTGANNSISPFAQVLCRTTGTNAPGIALTVDKTTMPADGTSTAQLTATLVNYTNRAGVTVTFARTTGTGTLVQTTAVTNAAGQASVTLRAPNAAGSGTFQASDTAQTPALVSNTVSVVYTPTGICTNPPTITSFTAAPASITSGGNSTLTWATTNVTSVSIDNGVGAGLAANGTRAVTPTTTTTYALTVIPSDVNCQPPAAALTTVTVQPDTCTNPPLVTSFTATPASIASGASSTLAWATSGASAVSINQGIGTVQASGTRAVTPTQTTTYTISLAPQPNTTCQTVTQNATVTVGGGQGLQLTLTVPLEGRLPTAGGIHGSYRTTTLEVTLSGPGITTPIVRSDVTTSDAGDVQLTFTGLTATAGSTYTVSLKDAQHLRRTVRVTAQQGNTMVLNLGQTNTYTEVPTSNPMKGKGFLPAGDIEGTGTSALHDNVANTFDIGAWLSAFRMQDATSLIADEDGNGAVGAEDLSLIIRNYNSTGDASS